MNNTRVVVASLALSAAAFVGILTREGYTEQAIIPVPGDVPTAGFGTTQGVTMKTRLPPVQAVQRALTDAAEYEAAVKRCVKAPLYQEEYDLYVDLTYNIGPNAFCNSSIVRMLNAQDYAQACERILDWKKFKGFDCSTPGNKICFGLWKDRLRLHEKCMKLQ